jgi:NAD(P)-dependent dehydrogenase (short-subunit alcohol dehydrogenase family)
MRIEGKTVAITGGAHGIGAALASRFAAEGAAGVLVADVDGPGAEQVAARIDRSGCATVATRTDVGDEADVQTMAAEAQRRLGPIDVMCSNAGRGFGQGLEASTDDWAAAWSVNCMAHVFVARAVLPSMRERGAGSLVLTCSAAGLLSQPGDAPYTTTKHAAVGLAEWLALTYGDDGIHVGALCPLGVETEMLTDAFAADEKVGKAIRSAGEVLEPEQVAAAVVEGLTAEQFLILPHPEVATYAQQKAADPERWLAGMRRLGRS